VIASSTSTPLTRTALSVRFRITRGRRDARNHPSGRCHAGRRPCARVRLHRPRLAELRVDTGRVGATDPTDRREDLHRAFRDVRPTPRGCWASRAALDLQPRQLKRDVLRSLGRSGVAWGKRREERTLAQLYLDACPEVVVRRSVADVDDPIDPGGKLVGSRCTQLEPRQYLASQR
jgi:hypothetical protein